jgi:NADH dehydrogenase/NADH:ubiquinone oxidoreductase subunit G
MRCLHCDCPALENCQLHHYAALYDCNARRFHGDGRRYEGKIADETVVLESGKCILCGICIEITRKTPGAAGLAFLGRSTQSRIGPADGCTLSEALGFAAQQCVEACPTGAFTLRQKTKHMGTLG